MKARFRQVAYAHIQLPDGTRLARQIVCFDAQGRVCGYEPLTAEQAFTEWRDETLVLPAAEGEG